MYFTIFVYKGMLTGLALNQFRNYHYLMAPGGHFGFQICSKYHCFFSTFSKMK